MVVLFDIVHPAQKHFYIHFIFSLQKAGSQIPIIACRKDLTHDLLHHYSFRVISVMQSGRNTRFIQLNEKFHRDCVE
jgi:predicted glycosyltransferase